MKWASVKMGGVGKKMSGLALGEKEESGPNQQPRILEEQPIKAHEIEAGVEDTAILEGDITDDLLQGEFDESVLI
jgi:hypothetical protein